MHAASGAAVDAGSSARWVRPGAKLGSYEIVVEIGAGAMGRVYLARVAGGSELAAVKVVRDHLDKLGEAFGDMLAEEARLAGRIDHPNVVRVLEVGEAEGRRFVAMEYVEGGSLADLIERGSHPEIRLVVPVVLDLLRGLAAAHAACGADGTPLELIHRDVCPQNVLVGSDGTTRVVDFGIAAHGTERPAGYRGSQRGRCGYLAPEQVLAKPIDQRADIFSAGVVLHNALTATELFRGDSEPETLHNVVHLPIPRVSEVGRRPPASFDAICQRALARDPGSRFRTAEEMADALRTAATSSGLLGSAADVAAWVRSVLADDIAARRRAVADQLGATRASRPLPLPAPPPPEHLPSDDIASVALDDELLDDDDEPYEPETSLYMPPPTPSPISDLPTGKLGEQAALDDEEEDIEVIVMEADEDGPGSGEDTFTSLRPEVPVIGPIRRFVAAALSLFKRRSDA